MMSPAAIRRSDAARRDRRAFDDARLVGLHAETELASEVREAGDIRSGSVAEPERLTLVNLEGVQRIAQNALSELTRRPAPELFIELQNECEIDSSRGQQIELLRKRCNQRRAPRTVQHMRGMRIEGDDG